MNSKFYQSLRLSITLFSVLLIMSTTACRSESIGESVTDTLVDLADIGQLQTAFEADTGKPRLLLILAPT